MSTNLHPDKRSELRAYLKIVETKLEILKSATPSKECVALRILQASCILQLQCFSEHVADAAANAAGDAAITAIESGAVWAQRDRGAWFWKCALHFAFRFSKRECRYVSIDSEVVSYANDGLDPEFLSAMVPHLRNALKGLPRQQRIAVLRRYVGGCSLNAVAKKLKVHFRCAKRLVREGLEHLRQTLHSAWQAQLDT